MADRIVILDGGRAAQIGAPEEIYNRPNSPFVAFRGVDAQRILKEEFAIDCSLSSTYRLLHRIKLSWLAPRPRHPGADATAQAAFSQHLDCN